MRYIFSLFLQHEICFSLFSKHLYIFLFSRHCLPNNLQMREHLYKAVQLHVKSLQATKHGLKAKLLLSTISVVSEEFDEIPYVVIYLSFFNKSSLQTLFVINYIVIHLFSSCCSLSWLSRRRASTCF